MVYVHVDNPHTAPESAVALGGGVVPPVSDNPMPTIAISADLDRNHTGLGKSPERRPESPFPVYSPSRIGRLGGSEVLASAAGADITPTHAPRRYTGARATGHTDARATAANANGELSWESLTVE